MQIFLMNLIMPGLIQFGLARPKAEHDILSRLARIVESSRAGQSYNLVV